ncbi:hypothetical protein JCM1840_000868 [Sporobolomyces johnsonii]
MSSSRPDRCLDRRIVQLMMPALDYDSGIPPAPPPQSPRLPRNSSKKKRSGPLSAFSSVSPHDCTPVSPASFGAPDPYECTSSDEALLYGFARCNPHLQSPPPPSYDAVFARATNFLGPSHVGRASNVFFPAATATTSRGLDAPSSRSRSRSVRTDTTVPSLWCTVWRVPSGSDGCDGPEEGARIGRRASWRSKFPSPAFFKRRRSA